MGQRTQLGIQIQYRGEGKTKIEREVFHYQWGGYSTVMFENLFPLFNNAATYIYKNNILIYELNEENILEEKLINVVNSYYNDKTSKELKYFKFSSSNINELTEKEYYDYLLNYQDCDDGIIMVDILIDGNKSHIKWCFRKNYSNSKEDFLETPNQILNLWEFDEEQKKYLRKIFDLFKESTAYSINNEVVEFVQYDSKFFENKLKDLKLIK